MSYVCFELPVQKTVQRTVHKMVKTPARVPSARHRQVAAQLVEEHARRTDEPLVLAVWFAASNHQDLHLLEVVKNFPGPADDELFSVESALPPHLALPGALKLCLASPEQLLSALDRGDPLVRSIDLRDAEVLCPPPAKINRSNSLAGRLLQKLRTQGPQ